MLVSVSVYSGAVRRLVSFDDTSVVPCYNDHFILCAQVGSEVDAAAAVCRRSAAEDDRSADCSRLGSSYLTGRETDGPNFPTKLLFTERGGPGGAAGGKGEGRKEVRGLQVAGLNLDH